MNITLQQAKGFVDVLLGDRFVGEDATKANSPLVRAFLKGVMPNGCPSDYAVNGANRPFATAKITIERDHFCDFLESVAHRLRNPGEQEYVPVAGQEEELKKLKGFVKICMEAWTKWFNDPSRAGITEMDFAVAVQEGLERLGINTTPEEKD